MGGTYKTYADIANGEWGREYTLDAKGVPLNPRTEELILGTLANIHKSLVVIRKAITPPAATDSARDRAEREEASRDRAWAAYLKAGGTMAADGVRGAPPEMEHPGYEPGAWKAALEAHKAVVVRWRKDNAPVGGTYSLPVSVLHPTARVRRAMRRLGVETLGELMTCSADELLAFKNFGQTSLAEVREKLKARGLHLRGES